MPKPSTPVSSRRLARRLAFALLFLIGADWWVRQGTSQLEPQSFDHAYRLPRGEELAHLRDYIGHVASEAEDGGSRSSSLGHPPLTGTLGALAYFKYQGMLSSSWAWLAAAFSPRPERGLTAFLLPLAISFFTFELIHYAVDVRQGRIAPHPLRDLLAFMFFFPTMVAGPIKRFQDFVPQVGAAIYRAEDMSAGLQRILIGFAKKMAVAGGSSQFIYVDF